MHVNLNKYLLISRGFPQTFNDNIDILTIFWMALFYIIAYMQGSTEVLQKGIKMVNITNLITEIKSKT